MLLTLAYLNGIASDADIAAVHSIGLLHHLAAKHRPGIDRDDDRAAIRRWAVLRRVRQGPEPGNRSAVAPGR